METDYRPFSLVALGLAVLLIATSCGGTSDVSSSADSTLQSTASNDADVSAATATETSAEASSDEPKSLDEYLGAAANLVRSGGGGGRGAGGGGDAEQQRLIEQQTQLCMQAEGFDYTPEAVTEGLQAFLRSENQGLTSQDYAATEGFGISTRFDAILEGDFDAGDETNPNDEYVASLSEGESDAYQLALRGQPPERNAEGQLVDPETGEPIQRGVARVSGGCQGEARIAVQGDFTVLGELEDEFAALEERIAADVRITEITRGWVDCMREAGFSFEDENEARSSIQQQLRPLLVSLFSGAPDQGAPDQGDADQGDTDRPGGGARGNILEQLSRVELSPEQDAELNALQDLEIADSDGITGVSRRHRRRSRRDQGSLRG